MSAAALLSAPDWNPGLTVEVVSNEAAFVALEPEWDRVVAKAAMGHPFLRHDWVRSWWEAFRHGHQLHVLVVREGADAIALAPLMISRSRMLGVPVRRLEFLANDHVPRFDFIVARRHEAAYRLIWEHLTGTEDVWDVLQLVEVPAGSRTLDELPRLAADAGFPVGLWPSQESPWLPIAGEWEVYLQTLRPKHRSNLRNRLKRLERLGAVELEVIEGGDELPNALDDALRLEAAAWKGRAGTAILCRSDTEAFYRILAGRAARRGSLRLCFLRVGGRRVAFAYCLSHENRVYVLKLGYDPEHAPYSPQNLLCFLLFRSLFESGARGFDFLGADEEWKREWARETQAQTWLFAFQPRLVPRLLHWAKFDLLPRLQRQALYRRLRARLLGAR